MCSAKIDVILLILPFLHADEEDTISLKKIQTWFKSSSGYRFLLYSDSNMSSNHGTEINVVLYQTECFLLSGTF
jgi:hypothetical protein